MTKAIPISQIVKVNPGVLAAAGSAVNLNGLILSNSDKVPTDQALPSSTPTDVENYFGYSSTEAEMARIYFQGYQNCTKTPGMLYFARYCQEAVPAWVRGTSLATTTLQQLNEIQGDFSIVVSGVEHRATVDLSDATSFSDAAQILSIDLNLAFTFDALLQAFVATDATSGVVSTITAATGPAAVSLHMDAGSGAVVSQGADASVPGDFMAHLAQEVTQNWALFSTTWEPAIDDKMAFSKWASSTSYRFGYVGFDSDPKAKQAGSTASWGAQLLALKLDGSVAIFGDHAHAAFVLGFAASLDFDRLNGRATLAFRTQAGLVPAVTSATDANVLKQNGYNWFGAYATALQSFNFMYAGSVSGQWTWLDSYLDQIWLNANLQLAMVQLLLNIGSLPYNSSGYSMVESSCMDPISKAVNFGAIRTGITLSEGQKTAVQNALGFDASPAIEAKGYYLQIQPATPDVRVARGSPPMTLFYTDGGSIQQLTLASIAVM